MTSGANYWGKYENTKGAINGLIDIVGHLPTHKEFRGSGYWKYKENVHGAWKTFKKYLV